MSITPREQEIRNLLTNSRNDIEYLLRLLDAERAKVARYEEPYRVQPPASSLRPMSSQAEPDWSNGVHA